MAGSQATNQLCLAFMTMCVFFTLNLRLGMDSVVNFTYINFFRLKCSVFHPEYL